MADFSFSYILGDKTFVQGVQLLSPASTLIYQDGKCSKDSYWHLLHPDSYPSRPDAWYDELVYNAIVSAINEMIEPDRRYGVALSGGSRHEVDCSFTGSEATGYSGYDLWLARL